MESIELVAFAVGGGIATFLSPCVYALLPGYVGYYLSAEGKATMGGAMLRGVVAALGIVLSVGLLSTMTYAGGSSVRTYLPVLDPIVGVLLLGLGIAVLYGGAGMIQMQLPSRRQSLLGFGLFGIVYGVAAIGCVLPVFLGVNLQAMTLPISDAILLIGMYVGTISGMMVVATVLIALGRDISISRFPLSGRTVTYVAGGLLVLGGIIQLGRSAAIWL